jgi:hypothetical protein
VAIPRWCHKIALNVFQGPVVKNYCLGLGSGQLSLNPLTATAGKQDGWLQPQPAVLPGHRVFRLPGGEQGTR